MKRIILTSLIIFSSSIVAHDLPNTFEAGQPIMAGEVNENFAELKNEIESIKAQMQNYTSTKFTTPELVGLSDPYIIGNLTTVESTNICGSKYDGAKMCYTNEIIQSNLSVLGPNPTVEFITSQYDRTACRSTSIGSDSIFSAGVDFNVISNGMYLGNREPSLGGLTANIDNYHPVTRYLLENKTVYEGNRDNADFLSYEHRDSVLIDNSGRIYYFPCKASLPVACCR